MWLGLATIGVVLTFTLYFGTRHSRDPFGIENTIGKTYYADHSEVNGYIVYNDFNQLTYLGSGVFEIDGIEYQIAKGEWDGRGTRKYILTLDKKKVITGTSFSIHVNVNKENEKINYDVWYKVYDELFLTKF